ncbi:D-amino-acid oxidase [Smittium culicis]|uniref:D-amino-acid oxidase n=1 Tax=Smittium culicis TaxID=133412 RepID=A0A1R1X8I1_9FUNG|nr:D-amino-acid oxidase [Smittium culicis]
MSSQYSSGKQLVVVAGAGVVGLSTALVMQQSGLYQVVIVSDHLVSVPASTDKVIARIKASNGSEFVFRDPATIPALEMASPYAGAHWRSLATNSDVLLQQCEKETFGRISALEKDNVTFDGKPIVTKLKGMDYYMQKPLETPWYFDFVSKLKIQKEGQDGADFPSGIELAVEYDTFVINSPLYCAYLHSEFIKSGGQFVKSKLSKLGDCETIVSKLNLGSSKRIHAIINCTALGSKHLADIKDNNMHPVRGQVVIVYAPQIKRTVTKLGGPAMRYVIPRGDGTVILGGTHLPNNFDTQIDNDTTTSILNETLDLTPELVPGYKPSCPNSIPKSQALQLLRKNVLAVKVGFRPGRTGGVRLEKSIITGSLSNSSITVIHNYGHSGFGVQSSWGFANMAYRMLIPYKL